MRHKKEVPLDLESEGAAIMKISKREAFCTTLPVGSRRSGSFPALPYPPRSSDPLGTPERQVKVESRFFILPEIGTDELS